MIKWPGFVKLLWWGILVSILGSVLLKRYNFFIQGNTIGADIFILIIWIALCLTPLFSEIELPGIKLKKEIENVQKQVEALSYQIRMNQELHTTVSPTFMLGTPPVDSKLPQIEAEISKIIKDTMEKYGKIDSDVSVDLLDIGDDVNMFFKARYNIEKELRELAMPYRDYREDSMYMSTQKTLTLLMHNGVISTRLANAIREIYSVCSPAIHGEKISQAKYEFVRDTAPDVVAALRAIARG